MRKLNKGIATVGGILCIFAIASIAFDFIQMFSYNAPVDYRIRNGIIQGLNILALLLLAVVLFRGKADIFGGIVCSLNIAMALYAVFSHSESVFIYLRVEETNPRLIIVALFYVLANLLKAAAFLTMALQCFKKKPGKNVLCFVLALICALVLILTTALNVVMLLGGGSLATAFQVIFRNTRALVRLAEEFIPGVFASVFLIPAGAAFANVRSGDTPADPYAMYKQYQTPYQPQYQYPQYPPQYQAPQYQQPQYQQPQYQAPQYQQPQYQAPQDTFQGAAQVIADQEQ